ncbi:hypothetical protein TNCV_3109271 [Trichonephila clavipes]|nr:hypothetical protein TNCV_3109271 [Trichonephila clavipes]
MSELSQMYKGGRLFRRRRFEEQVPGAHLTNRFDLPNTAGKKLSQLESTPPPTMEPNKGRQPAGQLTCVRGTALTSEVVLDYSITEPVLESAELITSRLTGAGSLLPPVYGGSMGQKGTQQEPQTPLSPVRVAAHGKHAGQTQKPVLTFRNLKQKNFIFQIPQRNKPKK